jgi:hypothetical protein
MRTPSIQSRTRIQPDRSAVARMVPALLMNFECQRDQFDDDVLDSPEWRVAAEAVDRAHRAWTCLAPADEVEVLCREAQRCVTTAIQNSLGLVCH